MKGAPSPRCMASKWLVLGRACCHRAPVFAHIFGNEDRVCVGQDRQSLDNVSKGQLGSAGLQQGVSIMKASEQGSVPV